MPTDPEPATPLGRRRYKRLKPAEWGELAGLYSSGSVTLAELSDQFGVSIRAIQNHMVKTSTVKGSAAEEVTKAAAAHVIATATPPATILAERIRATKDSAYTDAVTLQSMLMAQLLPIKEGAIALPAGAVVRMIDQAANALDRLRRLQWAALGLDKCDSTAIEDLPVLPIRELTREEEAQIRAEQEAEDRALGIHTDELGLIEENEIVEEGGDEARADEEAKS